MSISLTNKIPDQLENIVILHVEKTLGKKYNEEKWNSKKQNKEKQKIAIDYKEK